MRRALAFITLLLLTLGTVAKADPPPKVGEDQIKRVEELRKAIAEKKTEIAKLEAELSKLKPQAFIEGSLDDKKVTKFGAISFELRNSHQDQKSGPERNPQCWINLTVINVSDKQNVATSSLANRFNAAKLTDDTGREYIIKSSYKSKADEYLVPGNKVFVSLMFPGNADPAAKSLYLVIPGNGEEPSLKLSISAAPLKKQ